MAERVDLGRLARLAQEATPGPWHAKRRWDRLDGTKMKEVVGPVAFGLGALLGEADADFVAAADPSTVAALVTLAEAALEAIPAINDLLDALPTVRVSAYTVDTRTLAAVPVSFRQEFKSRAAREAQKTIAKLVAALAPFRKDGE